MNQDTPGRVYETGTSRMAAVLDREALVGAVIAEPCWISTIVNSVQTTRLIQAFKRRILTYTPDADPAQRVPMTSVGTLSPLAVRSLEDKVLMAQHMHIRPLPEYTRRRQHAGNAPICRCETLLQ